MKPANEMLEEGIRKRAYYLGEASGRPEGRDHEFWSRARELIAIEGNLSAGRLPNVVVRADPPAKAKPQATPRRRRRKE
jgi:hypothetical protein